jgi:hypothetical protein
MLTCRQISAGGNRAKITFTHPDYHTYIDWSQTFPFQQFHALFNSLFKVLFIFPSRYLFAIGLSPIFSLGRKLPPNSSCNPKQLYSLLISSHASISWVKDGILTLYDTLSQRIYTQA